MANIQVLTQYTTHIHQAFTSFGSTKPYCETK